MSLLSPSQYYRLRSVVVSLARRSTLVQASWLFQTLVSGAALNIQFHQERGKRDTGFPEFFWTQDSRNSHLGCLCIQVKRSFIVGQIKERLRLGLRLLKTKGILGFVRSVEISERLDFCSTAHVSIWLISQSSAFLCTCEKESGVYRYFKLGGRVDTGYIHYTAYTSCNNS